MIKNGINLIYIFLSIILAIIIQIIGVNVLLQEDLFKTKNLNYETNDFCQTKINKSKGGLEDLVCENKFKKEKIIFFLLDSLPYDSLHDFHNLKKYKMTNFFRGKGIEYKQSGALFETILTGKFNRNYLASNKMKSDSLAQQFKNSNMSILYHVRPFPLGGLIDSSLGKFDMYDNGEESPLSTFCDIDFKPFHNFMEEFKNYFINDININFMKDLYQDILYDKANEKLKNEFLKIRSKLNQCFEKNNFDSLVFFTDALDHINHVSYRSHPKALFAIYYIENLIKEIIDWIDEEHGEYALAIASDHGGQLYFGEDTLCNHGCNSPGNEAVFFVYTKELGEDYERYKTNFEKESIPIVSMNDIPCTISQVLKNTNLPLESTCTPRLVGNDKLLRYTSVKSKEIQLIKFIEKFTLKYPKLSEQYNDKYVKKLKDNKFTNYFEDLDSVYKADEKFYDEYMNYLIDIQQNLNSDVIKSGQDFIYYLIYIISLILFFIGFIYCIRKLILATREKVLKELKKNEEEKSPLLKKLVKYVYILIPILLLDPIMCLIYINSKEITPIINLSIFIKYIGILVLAILIYFINNLQKNKNYTKFIIILFGIIIIHLIMHKIELFSFLDKTIDTQAKNDFLKKYFSYPLLLAYICLELYSIRNYYINYKYKIRYIYILIPYLVILVYYFLKFDLFYLELNTAGHPKEIISLIKKIYLMICSLLLFIKPFVQKNNNINLILSSDILNVKLFFFMMLSFICVDVERFEIILFCNIILYYLCNKFKNENDIFLKLLYLLIIICYPQIHFIGNQGTYTLDTSIKVTSKCPSKWADDRPIIMGIIFVADKFRFNIICIGYVFSLIKISKKNILNYYTKVIILVHFLQLFGVILCFLYYFKKERESFYIQILYLIAVQVMPIILFEFAYIINYILYSLLNKCFKIDKEEYTSIDGHSFDLEENQIFNTIKE